MNETTTRFFYGGMIVGFLLVFVGLIAMQLLELSAYDSRVVLYTGIGILLGAFGSTATVKYKGMTITGVAAITIMLLYLVTGWIHETYIEGVIKGNLRDAAISVMSGDKTFLGATRLQGQNSYYYSFVVPAGELVANYFDVEIVRNNPEEEFTFRDIPRSFLEKHRGSGRKIEWRLDIENRKLYEADGKKSFADENETLPLPELPVVSKPITKYLQIPFGDFISTAYAQSTSVDSDVDGLLRDLTSPNSTVRRNSRSKLAAIGPAAVTKMMQGYRTPLESYRTRLGVLVALTEMLRTDKSQASKISDQIDQKDLNILVQALAHRDRTMRIYAAEFLYDLGDTRVVKPALELAHDPTTFATTEEVADQGRYLAIFVISEAYPRLDQNERRLTACELHNIEVPKNAEKTKELILSIAEAPTDCDPPYDN